MLWSSPIWAPHHQTWMQQPPPVSNPQIYIIAAKSPKANSDISAMSTISPAKSLPHQHYNETSRYTYAEALRITGTHYQSIRNIHLIGTETERTRTLTSITQGNVCTHNAISSIKSKGHSALTIKCRDANAAKSVDSILKQEYRTAIQINQVRPRPLIKRKLFLIYNCKIHGWDSPSLS